MAFSEKWQKCGDKGNWPLKKEITVGIINNRLFGFFLQTDVCLF